MWSRSSSINCTSPIVSGRTFHASIFSICFAQKLVSTKVFFQLMKRTLEASGPPSVLLHHIYLEVTTVTMTLAVIVQHSSIQTFKRSKLVYNSVVWYTTPGTPNIIVLTRAFFYFFGTLLSLDITWLAS